MLAGKDRSVPSSSKGSTSTSGGRSEKKGLRGLSFEQGTQSLAPVDEKLKKPGLGARITNANYAKLYDLYGKYLKAAPTAKPGLLTSLDQAIESWLQVHDGTKKHDKSRLPAVKRLAEQVKAALRSASPEETTSEVVSVKDTRPPETSTTDTTPETSSKDTKPPETTPIKPPETSTPGTQPLGTVDPKTSPPLTVSLVVPEEIAPTTEPQKTEQPKDVPPPKDLPPPIDSSVKPLESKPPSEVVEEVKENPVVSKLSDAKIELTAEELKTLDYGQIVSYLDTRDKALVEKLRTDSVFISHAESLGSEQLANIVCRILLRTPDSVINKGGSRAEAIRILSSQLRDAEVCKNLLANEAFVVIIPKNKLMTDFPEFSKWAGTYTFDGRPWDVTRGMGGVKSSRNTAITEENLLGEEVDGSVARKGWHSKEWMEHSKKNGATETNENGKVGPKTGDTGTKVFKAGVYCSGYSTTNHEFFHTIHSLGLNSTDHAKIQSEYDEKKKQPDTTEWADGPRLSKTNTHSENYASSTVFEYFAQTGCAFQGTNTGTDSYTGRPRNNGRSWVEENEPELAKILGKVCSDSELKNVNPRDAKKPPTTTTPTTPVSATTTTGGSSTTTPSKTTTETTGGTKVGDSVAGIVTN
ncbi:MAG TPA: hypothetical protein PK095_09335 [Myxococcota bacterium]|nr:hypothetical protein [Myxococcota bacterium]